MGLFHKATKYMGEAANQKFDEKADPRVQIEQAIHMAQEHHDDLSKQASIVVAQQKQAEMRLHELIDKQTRTKQSATFALQHGNDTAAQALGTELASLNGQVESQTAMVQTATEAAQRAKQAMIENEEELKAYLDRRQSMIGQLEQAKMTEKMNQALDGMSGLTARHDVPNLDDVQQKINERYALAQGTAEIQDQSVSKQLVDEHHMELQAQGQAELDKLRAELGMGEAKANG